MWFSAESLTVSPWLVVCQSKELGWVQAAFFSSSSEATPGDFSGRTKTLQSPLPVLRMSLDFKRLPGAGGLAQWSGASAALA